MTTDQATDRPPDRPTLATTTSKGSSPQRSQDRSFFALFWRQASGNGKGDQAGPTLARTASDPTSANADHLGKAASAHRHWPVPALASGPSVTPAKPLRCLASLARVRSSWRLGRAHALEEGEGEGKGREKKTRQGQTKLS